MFATQNSPIRFRQAFGVLLIVASLSCGAAYPPLTGQGATNSQSAYQEQIRQQQIQLQQQLAERRQAAQQRQDQARQEQARQQQIQLQQQLAERRQYAQQQQDQARQEQARQQQIQLQQHLAERRQYAQQQQDQARQEQARQQQIQLQQQVAERRQAAQQRQDQARQEQARQQQIQLQQQLAATRAAQVPSSTYKDPHNAKIGPATQPSYAAGQDWRGYYAEVPRVVPNQVTGAGSLSTNQGSTIQYDHRRVGSDNARPLDAAKTAANYVNTHREETLMNGISMLVGAGEARAAVAGVEVAGKTAVNALARTEATNIAGKGMAGTVAKQTGGAVRSVNPLNGDMNCVNCAVALDFALRGNPSSALLSGKQPITAIEEVYGRKFAEPTTIAKIWNQMSVAGNGSAGIVYGAPIKGTVGHVFNVVNQRGVVRFLDGQQKETAIARGYKYFQLIRTK